MKSKTKKVVIVCLVICIGIAMAHLYSLHLRKTSVAFNFIFPPEDIFLPLAETPFGTFAEGSLYECFFTAKYPGNHAVKIFVENPLSISESYGEDFSVEVAILDANGSVLLKRQEEPPFMPFRGLDNSGLYLFYFKVPNDVPIRTPLKALVEIKTKDIGFENKHGPFTLCVMKMSDE